MARRLEQSKETSVVGLSCCLMAYSAFELEEGHSVLIPAERSHYKDIKSDTEVGNE